MNMSEIRYADSPWNSLSGMCLRFALSLSLTSQIPVQNFAKLDFCLWGLYYESHQHQNLHMQCTNDTLQIIG